QQRADRSGTGGVKRPRRGLPELPRAEGLDAAPPQAVAGNRHNANAAETFSLQPPARADVGVTIGPSRQNGPRLSRRQGGPQLTTPSGQPYAADVGLIFRPGSGNAGGDGMAVTHERPTVSEGFTYRGLREWLEAVDRLGQLRVVHGANVDEEIGAATDVLQHTAESPAA